MYAYTCICIYMHTTTRAHLTCTHACATWPPPFTLPPLPHPPGSAPCNGWFQERGYQRAGGYRCGRRGWVAGWEGGRGGDGDDAGCGRVVFQWVDGMGWGTNESIWAYLGTTDVGISAFMGLLRQRTAGYRLSDHLPCQHTLSDKISLLHQRGFCYLLPPPSPSRPYVPGMDFRQCQLAVAFDPPKDVVRWGANRGSTGHERLHTVGGMGNEDHRALQIVFLHSGACLLAPCRGLHSVLSHSPLFSSKQTHCYKTTPWSAQTSG